MWRPGKFTTAQRVNAAREIAGGLRKKYGDRLVAVAMEGSTAKGLDRPESDLEFTAIVQDGVDRWYPFFYNDISVGISYCTPEDELQEAASIDYTWPVTGDVYFTAKVLYDPSGFYDRLRNIAADAENNADFIPLIRDALADVYENVLKVFSLEPEQTMAAAMSAARAAYWSAMTVALVNRHKYLSTRAMFSESTTLAALPLGYKEGIQGLLGQDRTVQALQDVLSQFWPALSSWAAAMGITMDDDEMKGI